MHFNILGSVSIKSEAQGCTEICWIFMCSPHFHAQIKLIGCMLLLGAMYFCFKRRGPFILFYVKTAFLRNAYRSVWLSAAHVCCGIVVETVGKSGIRLYLCSGTVTKPKGATETWFHKSIAPLYPDWTQAANKSHRSFWTPSKKKQGEKTTARADEIHWNSDHLPVTKHVLSVNVTKHF